MTPAAIPHPMKSANSLPQHAMVADTTAPHVVQQREAVSDGGDSAMLDDGLDYFAVQGARDRAGLERGHD